MNQDFETFDIEQANYDDLLSYAKHLSDELMEFLPPSFMDSKETLIDWISSNEPNYDPEDDNV